MSPTAIELERLLLLSRLEAAASREDRGRLGQFATPPEVASQIVERALEFLGPATPVRFLEPGFGTGTFFSALLSDLPSCRLHFALGFEIDPLIAEPVTELWAGANLDLRIADFTRADPPPCEHDLPNLIVCNPPYVRHAETPLAERRRTQSVVEAALGLKMFLTSGLHVQFLLLSHAWLAPGGIGAWLLPAWTTEITAGKVVREYLTDHVTLLRLHQFGPTGITFGDVEAPVMAVWFRKDDPPPGHRVAMTTGTDVIHPDEGTSIGIDVLRGLTKWASLGSPAPVRCHPTQTIGDWFTVRRGIATGANEFFVLDEQQVAELNLPREFLRPILPSPRSLKVDEVLCDGDGLPIVEPRLFLLDCALPLDEIDALHPSLGHYLRSGEDAFSQRALCRKREPWYAQEKRGPPPFLCNYMGRPSAAGRRPFRFILNHSRAVAGNGYLMMYPKPELEEMIEGDPDLKRRVWEALRAIPMDAMIAQGRTYPGGLHKLEPRELDRVGIVLSSD